MADYDDGDFHSANPDDWRPADRANGPRLPGGLSMQAAGTGLLLIVLAAALWLFFGPQPSPGPAPGLPTATSRPAPTTQTTASPGTAGRTAGTASAAPAAAVPGATAEAPSAERTASSGVVSGGFVRVTGTGSFDLRLRFGPGTEYVTIRIVEEGELLRVTGGPELEDQVRWWRLQDDLGNIGWAAEEYLSPVAAPADWNPPAASPTFEAGAGDEAGQSASPEP